MTVISEQTDTSLLQQFAENRSQDAFSRLVSRHSDWVYSAALRQVRDRHLAEDVTQAVFLVLADKAPKLADVPLHRWLFKVTRYASANARRARTRRETYERRAAMQTTETLEPDSNAMWGEIAPMLDDLMDKLRSQDRDAILLRFYQHKSIAEVAQSLGVTEGAAKIRILRAVEKLRSMFHGRGVVVPTDALSAALIAYTTHAAPVTLNITFSVASAASPAVAIAKGASTMLATAKIKILAAILLVGSLIPAGAGAIILAASNHPAPAPSRPVQVAIATPPAAPAVADASRDLDPLIAPYVDRNTDLIFAVDLGQIDLNALSADMQKQLAQSNMDTASKTKISGILQQLVGMGGQWITAFKNAGGNSFYLISRADQLKIGTGPKSANMSVTGTLVFPTASPEAAKKLSAFLGSLSAQAPSIVGTTVVWKDATPATQPNTAGPDPRPGLAAALNAAGDAPIRVAINPAKLKQIMPAFTDMAGKGLFNFSGNEWDDVQWCNFMLVLPPSEAEGFVVVSHYTNAAAAEKAQKEATRRLDETLKGPADNSNPLSRQIRDFVRTEKFTTSDNEVTATLDLHVYWNLLFEAIRMGS